MRTLEKIFPGFFAALGITLAATWFALVIVGAANMIVHILFLFFAAFIFEIYSSNQEYEANEARRKREMEEVDRMLDELKHDDHEEMIHELEEEYNL
ncbi:MAG: hypothetical protein KDD10_14755 [Phaeodactylibacter sp.]|nr:hypothetical protein [Phaeodactylibacter sp.]MCB9298022.1 hypothetical protein [Lewinellaceae bacterium]